MFLKEHPIMYFSKIVISTRHVYTYKCGVSQRHIVKSSKMAISGYIRLLMIQNVFCFLFFFFWGGGVQGAGGGAVGGLIMFCLNF